MSHRSILDLEDGESMAQPPPSAGIQPPSSPDKLKIFRDIVGINPLPTDPSSRRPAENQGTYKRLVDAELKARLQYYVSASIINVCLLAQIVIAAALTALGAANASHIAITILGSANTVIAGGMTYLKGQGLPERILQYANGLRKVREYVEERERQFMRPDCPLDVDQEVRTVLRMYEAVRQKAEDSYSRDPGVMDPKKDRSKTKGDGTTTTNDPLTQPMIEFDEEPTETKGKATADKGENKPGDAQEEGSGRNN